MNRPVVFVMLWSLLLTSTPALAQVPRVLGYHGMLTDAGGKPFSPKAHNVIFAIHKSATGAGQPLWSEVQSVTPDADGYFSVVLGGKKALPDGLLGTGELNLQIQVGSQKLTPLQRIVSAPTALLASAGGTLEIRGELDMSYDYNNIKKIKVHLKARPRVFKLRLVGGEFTRYHYTELPKHDHALTGGVSSESATCSAAGSHSHSLSGTIGSGKAACGAAGTHTHKASGTIGTSTVTVNAVGNHSHKLSGTANATSVSCSGGNHNHTFTGGTSSKSVPHRHRIRGYHGNAGCAHFYSSCPGTGYYDSGHSLALRSTPDKIPGMSNYGIAPVMGSSSWGYTDYHSSMENIAHSHPFSGATKYKTVSVGCGSHKHSLSGSALSGGGHSHSTKSHGHTLSLTVPSTGSHTHSCSGHSHTLSATAASGGSHGHTCTHSHKHTLKAGSAGVSSGTLAKAAKTYPKFLKVFIDNMSIDCTSEILLQASKNWGSSYTSLGDGTKTHPLVAGYKNTEGTGELDLLKLNYCINAKAALASGDHTIIIQHGKSGGGKVRYEIVVEY